MSRARVNATGTNTGITHKKAVVERIEGEHAICRDTHGHRNYVRIDIQRAKGLAPGVGETWMLANDMGMWTFAAIVGYDAVSDFIGATRETITLSSGTLAANASVETNIELPAGFRLYSITTDYPARVRIYDNSTNQADDLGRAATTNPGPGAGCLFDYITAAGYLSGTLSPLVDGFNDGSGSPITIQNKDTVSRSIAVTFEYLRTE